ncbi:choice-of-anchor Q domain-containing protein [Rufibacter immobilis]|nr:choice-of-anchor Q domain-containing protein [Rufibacter immobilis]
MINASSANHQVWVAKGIYKPNRKADALGTLTPNNRDNAFVLKADVKIYGGFTGTETQLAQRNSMANSTVLSGDYNGDDLPGSFDKHIENAHHIVISVGNVGSAELSGFTITGGYAFGSGSITVNGQSIYRSYGGGIFLAASSPGLSQLTVTANAADVRGGGINNQSNSSPRITHTTLRGNSATNGGAIYNRDSNPLLSYITVSNNIGTFAGGGIYSYDSSPVLTNALVTGNIAERNHGGGLFNSASWPVLTHVTISGNTAAGQGGALYNGAYDGVITSASIRNSILHGNTNSSGESGIYNSSGSQTTLAYSLAQGVAGGTDGNLPGTTDPRFVNPQAGDYRLFRGSPAINAGNNTFLDSGQIPDLSSITTDLDGKPRRFNNSNVDLGPYENQTAPASIRYVKVGGTGDGSSWALASGDLKAMINASAAGDQIWVAAGEYQPNSGGSFSMKEGVKVYGGFSGTEQTLAERDHRANLSILKGNGNSVLRNEKNGLTPHAVLDGFTLTGGNSGFGGGMYNLNVSPTLSNLIISGNRAMYGGGGHLTNSSPTLTHVTVSGNEATAEGAGFHFENSSPQLNNVLISGNLSANGAGGIYTRDSQPILTNVTIAGNKAKYEGAGIYQSGGPVAIRNSILHGNSSGYGESGLYIYSGTAQVSHSLVQGRTDTANGNIPGATSPLFASPLSPGLSAAGNYSLQPLSPAIDAGDNGYLMPGLATDLAGHGRLSNNLVDMGAFEWQANDPLPVKLIQFTAQVQGGRTKLTWQTAAEINSKEFILYRSTDGRQFVEMCRIPAAGNTSAKQDYSYWDETPEPGVNYYRLEQEDYDGSRERFSIKAVLHTSTEDRLVLFPNPAGETVKARFRAGRYGRAELSDVRGRVLQRINIAPNAGSVDLEIGGHAAGTYILRLYGEEGVLIGKLWKW